MGIKKGQTKMDIESCRRFVEVKIKNKSLEKNFMRGQDWLRLKWIKLSKWVLILKVNWYKIKLWFFSMLKQESFLGLLV